MTPGEIPAVNRLATDVFSSKRAPANQVPIEYPLIFQDPNLENRRGIFINGKPVSYVEIHIRQATFFGCEIRVGSPMLVPFSGGANLNLA